MWLSREASFGIAAILVPAGIYCVRSALQKSRAHLGLAAVPLLLGVLELAAGLAGGELADGRPDGAQKAAIAFLLLALALWPAWMPFAAYRLEARPLRKKALGALALLSLGWLLVFFLPVASDPDRWLTAAAMPRSIESSLDALPIFQLLSTSALRWIYTATVAVPLLIHEDRRVVLLGAMLAASSVMTYVFFPYAFASVFCFLAAALSLDLCALFARLHAPGELSPQEPAPAPAS